jgi:hypothetical protein
VRERRRPQAVRACSGPVAPVLIGARRALFVAAVAVMGLAMVLGPSAAEAAVPAGTAEITQAGLTTPLDSGGSATDFSVTLPQGAKCPGDTAHDGYHVFSYLVPRRVSPTQVSFKGIVPSKYFGFIALGEYYFGAADTAPFTDLVVNIPAFFVFSRFTPAQLFTAGAKRSSWDGGIACVDVKGHVTNYWSTSFVFTASSSDPGGFTWAVANPGRDAVTPSNGFPTWLLLVLVGVTLVAAGFVFWLGQRSSPRRPKVVDAP